MIIRRLSSDRFDRVEGRKSAEGGRGKKGREEKKQTLDWNLPIDNQRDPQDRDR